MGQPSNYGLCDFCHVPHKQEELEKVKVTYKKCTDCDVALAPKHNHVASVEEDMPAERPPMPNFMNQPPPNVMRGMMPPEDQKL
jgi:hypothetical protein